VTGKPTLADLGIDPGSPHWQRSGEGSGAIEVAFVQAPAHSAGLDDTDLDSTDLDSTDLDSTDLDSTDLDSTDLDSTDLVSTDLGEWVLMRVTDDPEGRILVFDRHEWECFLDGARKGEFDDAVGPAAP
jgi:uncharacterized protein YjbI with pentapeptide repeats